MLKFFLNSSATGYLRGLEDEFGESTNSIRLELNKFEEAGMITSHMEGNKKVFSANREHPLFNELHNILLKHIGIDQIIEKVLKQLGDVREVYLAGSFAHGINSEIIDIEIVGQVNSPYLAELVDQVQRVLIRKVRYVVFSELEYSALPAAHMQSARLLIWSRP